MAVCGRLPVVPSTKVRTEGLFFNPQGCEVSKSARAVQRRRSLRATGVRGEEGLGILMSRAGEKASGWRGSRRVSPLRDGRGQGACGTWLRLTRPRNLPCPAKRSERSRHTRTPTTRERACLCTSSLTSLAHADRHSLTRQSSHSKDTTDTSA